MSSPAAVRSDLERSPIPDERLRQRAGKIAARLAERPDQGLPRVFSESELEATYRFVNNPRVSFDALLEGHAAGTLDRLASHARALAVHDTTAFVFTGVEPRAGLGVDSGGRGFTAHFCLLVSQDGVAEALGVGGVEPIFRMKRRVGPRQQKKRFRSADKESLRWLRMVDHVEGKYGRATDLIHVMDSEADWYDLFDHLVEAQLRFVVRLTRPRVLLDDRDRRLRSTPNELLTQVQAVAEREVQLSARTGVGVPPNSKKKFGPRKARVARLEIAARHITIARPKMSPAKSDSITFNVVQVRELDPPDGCEPVEWLLATSEPIHTPEHVLEVVDNYRARWSIEEYFKALKTGCAYEKRQFESKHALLNMLGLVVPIAWTLLALKGAIRRKSTRPGTRLLTTRQVSVLSAVLRQRIGREVLGASPTEEEVALGLALLGGYLNKSRPPGWQILGRGLEDLLIYEAGWAIARGEM